MAKEYREKVEKELRDICHDVLVSFLLDIGGGGRGVNTHIWGFVCDNLPRF